MYSSVLKTLAKITPNADPVFRDECKNITSYHLLLCVHFANHASFNKLYIHFFLLFIHFSCHPFIDWGCPSEQQCTKQDTTSRHCSCFIRSISWSLWMLYPPTLIITNILMFYLIIVSYIWWIINKLSLSWTKSIVRRLSSHWDGWCRKL